MLSPLLLSLSASVGLLAGCTPTDDTATPTVDTDDDTEPSPYLVDDVEPATFSLTADQVVVAINEVIATAVDYDGHVAIEAFDEVMAYADDACPMNTSTAEGDVFWDTICTAESGATYSGLMSLFESETEFERRGDLRAEVLITTPSDEQLVIAGDIHTSVNLVNRTWYSSVAGVVDYNGPASVGSWLEDASDITLEYTLSLSPEDELLQAVIDGSITTAAGAGTAVDMDDFVLSKAEGFPCPMEPSGRISIRDSQGVWADVVFDVELEGERYTIGDGACDGCGTLWYDGENLGPVCVDVDPPFQAEMPPW
ncbi:MAG: hypothetical protein ACI8RZ_002618 [Myxococcota bacterium]|jgi:hypothetical protein